MNCSELFLVCFWIVYNCFRCIVQLFLKCFCFSGFVLKWFLTVAEMILICLFYDCFDFSECFLIVSECVLFFHVVRICLICFRNVSGRFLEMVVKCFWFALDGFLFSGLVLKCF